MADAGRSDGLGIIFSFFLGLMVTAFVGVGVYTFHPRPHHESNHWELMELNRREQVIRSSRSPAEFTAADREEIQQIGDERRRLLDASGTPRERWGRSTSIILVVLATCAMAVSLIRAGQLPVISNGLLLGGVLTMVYGVGWIVVTDTSISRFFVISVALAVTLALGYARFVRRRLGLKDEAFSPAAGNESSDIDRRLRALERRIDEAAKSLLTGGLDRERPR
jgi:hypothetical protein